MTQRPVNSTRSEFLKVTMLKAYNLLPKFMARMTQELNFSLPTYHRFKKKKVRLSLAHEEHMLRIVAQEMLSFVQYVYAGDHDEIPVSALKDIYIPQFQHTIIPSAINDLNEIFKVFPAHLSASIRANCGWSSTTLSRLRNYENNGYGGLTVEEFEAVREVIRYEVVGLVALLIEKYGIPLVLGTKQKVSSPNFCFNEVRPGNINPLLPE